MKILYVTMGQSLQVFLRLHEHLQRLGRFAAPAVYVADSVNYRGALREFPELAHLHVLKEWELFAKGRTAEPDLGRLKAYQSLWPDSLWGALLADRRVFFGRLCKAKQDYQSVYSERQMLAILDVSLSAVDRFLDATKPDVVLGFGTTTVGDYIFELLAKQKGIPFWQLKATKIRNLLALSDSGIDVSSHLAAKIKAHEPCSEKGRAEAIDYIDSVRQRGMHYEGTILFSRKRMLQRLLSAPRHLAAACRASLRIRMDPVFSKDNHIPPAFGTACLTHVVHPVRTFMIGRQIDFARVEDLRGFGDFLFYPMHFEPEVALQVFGKPFQNQIELIRNLALSVPVGMRVLVKEHPRSLGFRKLSYYRKILDIPNVRLVDPFVPAVDIVRHARIVAVVSGAIGLEAIILKKPLLVFGKTPYSLLPERMVAEVRDVNRIDRMICQLLENYRFDEGELLNYISSMVAEAAPVDLYTKLLEKQDRYAEDGGAKALEDEYRRLAEFVFQRIVAAAPREIEDRLGANVD